MRVPFEECNLKPHVLRSSGALALAILCLSFNSFAQQGMVHGRDGITLPPPPVATVTPVTNDYFGTKVVDKYRWLEDASSPKTLAWIKEENAYTQKYLDQVAMLPRIRKGLTALERIDDYTMPVLYGGKYFFEKRLADQNQASIYMRDGWTGNDQLLIDATKLSQDQNTSVHIWGVSDDGALLLYAEQQGGADQVTIHFYNVAQRHELPDTLPYARYFGASFGPKNQGVYFARFSDQGTDIWYHRFGTASSADKKIFGGEYRGKKLGEMALVSDYVTDNQHYLVINISYGVPATRDDILIKDLRKPDSPVVPLVYGIEAHNSLLDCGDRFFVQTDFNAPHGRIVEVKPGEQPADWKSVIPEGKDVIDSDSIVGDRLFVSRLHDVKTETTIYSLDGTQTGTLPYPGIGSGTVVYGRPSGSIGFYRYESFITPPSIYRYDTKTGRSQTFFQPKIPFDSANYEIHQVWFKSKDGTRVPMFIAGKKGIALDGKARLLMTGYGGFDLPMLPTWNPEYAWWMQQGGFFALPNLRGGDEFGEAWHKAAMFGNKQNVFNDFFAAAEYLIQNHYTTPTRFAIRGRSNGGLLMGAAMTQRPDLFGAIWCGYPLLDMLRYQYFEFGRLWTTEYGSSASPKDFPYLLKYSPYQNVHKGTKYPAIMFFTGKSDTRVDPMNARKMTALMQASTGSDRPILLHYSLKGGHSSGVSLTQLVEDQVEELAFLWTETARH
jgi:prolyl oligopeptidase